MALPINESTIKLLWENNPDTPLTSSTLSKDIDYVSSYRDFEFANIPPHSEGTILMNDPDIPLGQLSRLIMKREVIIGIINLETRIPVNKQYKVFDNGLQDLYIRVQDIDDSSANPPYGSWGENKEWFVYLCDAENAQSGQLLVSLSRVSPQNTKILGNTAYYYNEKNVRMIGGFKTDGSSNIITSSVWDIAGKNKYTKAKQYFILDEYGADDLIEDPHGRFIYRPLRSSDLDTSYVAGNVFGNDITIQGNLVVNNRVDDTTRVTIDSDNNLININGISMTNDDTLLSIDGDVSMGSNEFQFIDDNSIVHQFGIIPGEFGIAFKTTTNPGGGDSILSVKSADDVDRLRVEHNGALFTGNDILSINGAQIVKDNDTPSGSTVLGYDGYFYATRVYNAVYNDLAEYFMSISELKAGKVYSLHSNTSVKISDTRADKKVVGVCSDSAAFLMKEEYAKNGGVPIALAGTVKVFVCSKVEEGDELVSDKNGFAVKANLFERLFKRSSILGKAMESSKDNDDKRILMLVK